MGGGPRVVVSPAAFHARVWGSVPGLGGLKETKLFLPHPRVKVSIVGSLRDREVACSVSDREGSNFESCVWRTVSSQSSHHPQEVLLVQFSLYVHKGGLKPDLFHLLLARCYTELSVSVTVTHWDFVWHFTHIQHQGSLSSVTSSPANQQPAIHKSGTSGEVDRDWPVVFRCTPAHPLPTHWSLCTQCSSCKPEGIHECSTFNFIFIDN